MEGSDNTFSNDAKINISMIKKTLNYIDEKLSTR